MALIFSCFHLKSFKCSSVLTIFLILYILIFRFSEKNSGIKKAPSYDLSHIGIKKYPVARNYDRIDWNDYDFIAYEAKRIGPGENGSGVFLTDPKEIELNQKLEEQEGLFVFISDKISVNRSLPDTRPRA